MNAVQLLQHSFANAFDILSQVTSDLTQDQCDWVPPGIANPIGAVYWHAVSGADHVVNTWCRGQAPLLETAGWKEKVLHASEPGAGEETVEQMRAFRVDLPVLHEYAQITAKACQEWLAELSPDDLDRKVHSPIGDYRLAEALATFVVWHIDAHCGEISALKGCLGTRGYPF
jgi:hypothetical protein